MPFAARHGLVALSFAALAVLAGCASSGGERVLGLITPYRAEVVQGNVITAEMARAVRPGMSRNQVREILGSPLLTDPFHADRWDYLFTIRRQGTEPQQRRVTAYFDGDRLSRLDAGELPSEEAFVASIDNFPKRRNTPTLQLSEEQVRALPAPKQPETTAPPPPEGPTRSYPPLE
jgi:outer membrane protein assembly factor BamE